MSIPENYHQALEYVESFSNSSFRKNSGKNKKDPIFYINRTRYFLGLIGNPEKGFSYIHVTGTAGKGTVSTMLQEVLVASGHKTGIFTSPYVSVPIEQIKIDDHYISPAEFAEHVAYLRPFIAESAKSPHGSPSSFELFFIIALLHFRKHQCDWVVLEVGLGGRYDATNIIEAPIVTAITNIDYDHTEILGKTLGEIASDKMGIIKKGSAFFASEQRPRLQNLFKKTCRDIGAEFHAIERQRDFSDYNRELVTAISHHLGISEPHIKQGIDQTRLPCRFEIMQQKPSVVLDGAHNRAKIKSTIVNLQKLKFKTLYIITAVADTNKSKHKILEPLFSLSHPTHIIITQVRSNERITVAPAVLMAGARRYMKHKSKTLTIVDNPNKALDTCIKLATQDDLILVTGSFFLAGELRKRWVSENWTLEHLKSFKQ